MNTKKNVQRRRGYSLIEILITTLLLIFVVIGFSKSIIEFMLYMKAIRINSRAKELGEQLSSEILKFSYKELKNCVESPNRMIEGTLVTTGTDFRISFDNSTFYTENCSHICKNRLPCLFCYTGEELKASTNNNCTVGYPIRVGYNFGIIYYNNYGNKEELGIAVGIKIYYNETKTKKERKDFNYLVFKKREDGSE